MVHDVTNPAISFILYVFMYKNEYVILQTNGKVWFRTIVNLS